MGALLALAAAALFGMNGSLVKVIVESGLTPTQVTLFRTLGMAVIAGLVLLVTDRARFRLPWRRVLSLALLGVVGIAVLQSTYAIALSLLPVGITLLLEYLAVLLVALFALVVYRERVRARVWVAIVLVLGGLAVIARIWASDLDPLGVVWALVAAVSLAFYFLYGERQIAATSALAVSFWGSLFAGLFWAVFSGWWTIEPAALGASTSLTGRLAGLQLPLWALIAITVVFGTFLPFFLSLRALALLKPTAAGIIASSEVVFAFAVAWLWLGETLDAVQLTGGALVLAGIVLAQTARPGAVADPDLAIVTGAIPVVDSDRGRVEPAKPST